MRNLLLASSFFLAACSLAPGDGAPALELPAHWPWENAPTETAPELQSQTEWWKNFGDPVLDGLMEEAIKANADILIAAARVAQARGALDFQRAEQLPELDVQAGATRTKPSRRAVSPSLGGAGGKPYNNFSAAGVLDFELDLWGRLASATDSARAQLLSVEANRDAVRLAIMSDVARGYFSLRALDAQLEITGQTVKSRGETYTYKQKQFRAEAISELDLRQSEAELEDAKAAAAQLEQARNEQVNALGVLLGRTPKELLEGNVERGAEMASLPVPPVMPEGLPSELLERRPDIRAAEENLKATDADIGVARADYFPRISLSALLGLSSRDADNLFTGSARNWQAGAGLVGPVLDFGRTSANVDVAKARKDEAIATYAQTVRVAFKDVLDAMSAEETSGRYLDALSRQSAALEEALRLAKLRYDSGYSSYLDVLDSERSLFQAQLDQVDASRNRLNAAIAMYQALGGGWSEEKTQTEAAPVIEKTPAAPETTEEKPQAE